MDERRRFRRYPVYCPIEFKSEGDDPRSPSITINISEGGALISSAKPLEVNTRLIIKVVMKSEVFFLRCRVVHVRREEDKDVYHNGIEFLQTPEDFIRKFYAEIEAIMLYQMERSQEAERPISLSEASINWYGSIFGNA